jgi:hypothetical protein
MSVLKINKKDLKMNNLVIDTNQHIKDIQLRQKNCIEATIASCQIEGINISREMALEISLKVEADIKKFLG